MTSTEKKSDAMERLEGEFIPPMEVLMEGRADALVPWERQLEAVLAWQAAGGNADNDWAADSRPRLASQSRRRVAGAEAGGALTMATVVRMTTTLVSLRERLLGIQNRLSEVSSAELRVQRAVSSDAAGRAESSTVRRPLGETSSRRITLLARDCVEALDSTRTGMAVLAGMVAPDDAPVERRQRAVLIDFPDRRAALG
jgi:hypothetical protein